MTNHYTDVCEATIESLRQTVERQAAQIEMMRQQLAAALAACKQKDEALKWLMDRAKTRL